MSASSSPRVAIVIPCYDQASFLPEAVESACAQTYEDLEIIIVDDGSPDDTALVGRGLAARHPERRIRLIRQDNCGLPASRNRAIAASTAEYLVALDADDKLTPRYVELKVAALDRHPAISIADGDHQTFGADNQLIRHGPYDFVRLTHTNTIGVAAMFRRRAWEDVGGYKPSAVAYEDWDFWVGCAERGHFAMYVPDAVFHYRVREGSMFGQVDDQRSKAHVVLNHPVLYAPEQIAWARGVIDRDPGGLAIDGPRYQIPVLGSPPVRHVRSGGSIEGARSFATLALAQELMDRPELLRTYCHAFSGHDDASLVVLGSDDQLAGLAVLLSDLDQDGADAADLVGLVVQEPETELRHAASMVDALLTESVHALPVPLPRVDASRLAALHDQLRRLDSPATRGRLDSTPHRADSEDDDAESVRRAPTSRADMIATSRDVAVLSFADELAADPNLLRMWAATFSGDDDITLVIHPGSYPEADVEHHIREAIAAAAIDDGDDSPDLVAITQRLAPEEELSLTTRCSAVYGHRVMAPFDRLQHVDEHSVADLRGLLAAGSVTSPAPPLRSPRQVTMVNNTWTFVHRGSEADLGVLQQIFGDEAYSLRRFDRWPGLQRYASSSQLGGRPLIIDCGANIGASSAYFSMLYPDARIVSVEPEKQNFELLCENVMPFSGVRPLNKAVASQAGTLVLSDPGIGEWGYRTTAHSVDGPALGEVQAVSIDDILSDEPGLVPFILKIDIEGAEGELFSQNTDSFARFPLVIVELHDWMLPGEGTSASFLRWHLSSDRDFVHYGENIFSLSSTLRSADLTETALCRS